MMSVLDLSRDDWSTKWSIQNFLTCNSNICCNNDETGATPMQSQATLKLKMQFKIRDNNAINHSGVSVAA
jgi:hypothetical protein